MRSMPKVLIVGGPDVDARLELMRCLGDTFAVGAVGSLTMLRDRFVAEGFAYKAYHLSRQVNPFADLLTLSELVLMLRELKPQIVHAFDTKPGVWACLAARLAGIPVIVGTVTGLGSLYSDAHWAIQLTRTAYQELQKLACRCADMTVFQNHDDARQFIARGVVSAQKALVILSSGVSTNVFAPCAVSRPERDRLRDELRIETDEIVVTMISRVTRSKGVLEFMAAAQEVRQRCPRVRFLLIGPEDSNGVGRLSSEELARLKSNVTWTGPRRDIPAALAISHVFVLPSAYREGIPRVLLEAASMKLPIVTTDSPGCNEVVVDGANGFLTPARDLEALIKAIVCLIEQPALRQQFGDVSRQRAIERFDLSVIAGQTRALYLHLMERKGVLSAMERC